MVETVIAARIQDFAESMGLLPEAQMRAQQGWSTETAVASLLAWVQAAWDEGSGRVDIRPLLCTEDGAKKLSHWWLCHGVLQQFSLARALEIGVEER